jgi:hypothetical protein
MMVTEPHVLARVDSALGDAERPKHFTDHTHRRECAEHDETLRPRGRETLGIADCGMRAKVTRMSDPGFDLVTGAGVGRGLLLAFGCLCAADSCNQLQAALVPSRPIVRPIRCATPS